MSQRVFRTDKHEITAGWDEPLKYFYLLIERLDATDDDADEGFDFNNLKQRPPGMNLAQIHETLERFAIIPPPTFYTDLIADQHNRRMNRHVYEQQES